jgi:nickel-dependent lactate racemase
VNRTLNKRAEYFIELPYGAQMLRLRIPDANLAGVFLPQPVEACANLTAEVERALAQPLDCPPLASILQPGETVVILVEDHTRPTPTASLLPPVLEVLGQAGVRDADVTIVITHGTHRLSTDQEVERIVGAELARRLRIVQHRCDEQENQIYVGITRRGTPVWVNRLVIEADRRIGVGYIGPSPYAGYSGGWKLIVPGVAALDTINANHSMVPLGFRRHGAIDLPTRLDIEEAAAMVGMDLVLDVVLCQDERVARAFAGTPDAVFHAGVELSRKVYEVACPGNLDIAIVSGYPYDIDLYQAVRAVEFADSAVREGGSIVLASTCPDGVGGEDFYHLMSESGSKPDDFLRAVVRRDGMVTFSVLGYCLTRIKQEKRLYLMSQGIAESQAEAMGFRPVRALQTGVDSLLAEYGPTARVGVFPMGSSTIPVLT